MAGKNVFNDKDSMDISELASLNGDISPELIEQLQQKLTQEAQTLNGEEPTPPAFNENDDTTLFEETLPQNVDKPLTEIPQEQEETKSETPEAPDKKKDLKLDKNFDDNFIKKYKAKLNKQQAGGGSTAQVEENETTISNAAFSDFQTPKDDIEKVSNGNITERALDKKQPLIGVLRKPPWLSLRESQGPSHTGMKMERIGIDTLHELFYNHPANRKRLFFGVILRSCARP